MIDREGEREGERNSSRENKTSEGDDRGGIRRKKVKVREKSLACNQISLSLVGVKLWFTCAIKHTMQ